MVISKFQPFLHYNQTTMTTLHKFREYFVEVLSNSFESKIYRFIILLI
ncbi:hypothetical protein NC651_028563 [Populus alba x Populus x berolinensis]|nr:hypothetical protein NC651_028563 [Populus alba x Populus x berolinensis]